MVTVREATEGSSRALIRVNDSEVVIVFVKFQKLLACMALVVAAALLAVGCGSSGGGSDDSSSSELAKNQTLVVNMGKETEEGKFVPAQMSALDSINTKGNVQFANLYRVVGKDSEVVPELATDAPEISEDGLTYTIKMRDDAMWSDGEPITAQDVVTGVKYALDPANAAPFAFTISDAIVGAADMAAGKKGGPELGVKAVDDHTVKITLVHPVPWFSQVLAVQVFTPLRADQLKKLGKDYGKSEKTAVSGPFKISNYKAGDHITFVKNDKYFDADDVKLKTLDFKMVADATTASREFERGDLDTGLQNLMFDAADIQKWKADDCFVSTPTVGIQYMYMNTRNKELSDAKVRQALALAINRKDIVENILQKGDVPAVSAVPPSVPGYDVWGQGSQDFLSEDGTPDVDKAKELLSEAGWDKKNTLNLYYTAGTGNGQSVAEQVQANLKDVGVNVVLKPTQQDVLFDTGYAISPTKSDVDLLMLGWIKDYLEAQDWYQLFYGPNVEGGLNSANYESADYDKIYDEAVKTVDDESRYELYKQLEAKLTGPDGDMPAAPLYIQADATLVQPWVKGFALIPSGLIYWQNISVMEHDD